MSPAEAVVEGVRILKELLSLLPEEKRDEVHQRINLAMADEEAHLREVAQAALDAR